MSEFVTNMFQYNVTVGIARSEVISFFESTFATQFINIFLRGYRFNRMYLAKKSACLTTWSNWPNQRWSSQFHFLVQHNRLCPSNRAFHLPLHHPVAKCMAASSKTTQWISISFLNMFGTVILALGPIFVIAGSSGPAVTVCLGGLPGAGFLDPRCCKSAFRHLGHLAMWVCVVNYWMAYIKFKSFQSN